MKQTEHPYWHRLYRCLEDFGTRYQNILLFGSFMGTWMKDKTFIFWSFLLGIIGFIRTYLIFRTADKKTYEIVEGLVTGIDGKNPFARLRKITKWNCSSNYSNS